MHESRQTLVTGFLSAFSSSFDIEPVEHVDDLAALCSYHLRDSKYVLVKKAELWAAENHEYLYVWSVPMLDMAALTRIQEYVAADGEPRVKPHSQHMYTFLSAVIIYDQADPDALAQLEKLKKRREYKLSLHGWMEFRIAAVDSSTGELCSNRSGKPMAKELQRLVARTHS